MTISGWFYGHGLILQDSVDNDSSLFPRLCEDAPMFIKWVYGVGIAIGIALSVGGMFLVPENSWMIVGTVATVLVICTLGFGAVVLFCAAIMLYGALLGLFVILFCVIAIVLRVGILAVYRTVKA